VEVKDHTQLMGAIVTDLTNWVSLGKLVKRFNNSLKPDEQQFKIDSQVVIIRDAFAHGRLVTTEEKGNPRTDASPSNSTKSSRSSGLPKPET
jgi:hypothetical protein